MRIVLTLLYFVSFLIGGSNSSIAEQSSVRCNEWMGGMPLHPSFPQMEPDIIENCDDKSFVVLSYEYAKDKNYVYFKPTPNRDNIAVLVEGADAESFELVKTCNLTIPVDKNRIYRSADVVIEAKNQPIYGHDAKAVLGALGHCPW